MRALVIDRTSWLTVTGFLHSPFGEGRARPQRRAERLPSTPNPSFPSPESRIGKQDALVDLGEPVRRP